MNRLQAYKAAAKAAKRNDEIIYIVYDESFNHNGHYHLADEYDMDTFYAGLDPEAAILPDGEIN